MPPRGHEVRIKHNFLIDDIVSVNVIVLNGPKDNQIIRSQVDLISQKVLYNWYVEKSNFVLIRPNNVNISFKSKLNFKDNLFLDGAKLRVAFTLKKKLNK